MRKTSLYENDKVILVEINGLQKMLSVGKNTASDIGENAGAVVRIGRRKLYNVKKVEEYINNIKEV